MKASLTIKRQTLDRLFTVRRVCLSDFMVIQKRTLVLWLFYAGILISFYASLTPWFLWGINRFYLLLAVLPICASLYYSRNLKEGIFNRDDYKNPSFSMAVLLLVMALTSGKNVLGVAMTVFNAIIYLAYFKVNKDELKGLGDLLALSMAALMVISIPFYILYLVGFPLPHFHVAPANFEYSFENYYFFLVDDRSMLNIIPRFHSVFLEPSHLGMACVALLYSQIGKWNTWRCRILFFTIVITFSLAAYICLVVLLFSAAWMKGKAVIGKLVFLFLLVAGTITTALVYKQGNNLVNQLIVQRLTMNKKGNLEGDNRTTDMFTKEFNKFASSGDLIFGKGMEKMEKFGSGNAGFRVFLYTYGLVSLICLIVFFYFILATSRNFRAAVTVLIISILSFIPHAIPVKFYFFIPLYILLFSEVYPKKKTLLTDSHGNK